MDDKKLTDNWEIRLSRDVEQAEAGTKTFASLTTLYYQELIKGGVPKKAAIDFTIAWITTIRGSGTPNSTERGK